MKKSSTKILLVGILLLVLSACNATNQKDIINNAVNENTANINNTETNNNSAENEVDQSNSIQDEPTTDINNEGITPAELVGQAPPRRATSEFTTDFDIHTIDYTEILSGGPAKDGIPAVDNPKFISVNDANDWLEDTEVVAVLTWNGAEKIYPIQILIWHEIVNDIVNGNPVSVTYCPLCNTAIAFNGKFREYDLDFGTTGRLRYSNLIMYDRQTETWWQQATGDGIAGKLTGEQLEFLPVFLLSWEQAKSEYPNASVLSKDTGHSRNYGSNPYRGYDSPSKQPFLYIGPTTPSDLFAMARVLTIDINGEAVAFPYSNLSVNKVANTTVGGEPVVVFWQAGVSSALDAPSLADGEDVGTLVAYSRNLNGDIIEFIYENGKILDVETNSEWNIFGEAINGSLSGAQLDQVVAINHFWFSWAAFRPDTTIYTEIN